MKKIIILPCIGAALAALTGCQRIVEDDVQSRKAVSFSVSTGYEPGTRTSFSGDISGTSSSYERIDWTDGDAFRVYSPEAATGGGAHVADYTVNSVTASGQNSIAGTSSANPLEWADGTNHFYAFYPAPTSANGASMSNSAYTGRIPATQTVTAKGSNAFVADMANRGYMYAFAQGNEATGAALEFLPLMTAFEFRLRNDTDMPMTGKLTTLKLSSTQTGGPFLAGDFTATVSTNGTYSLSVANGSNTITVTLPGGGVMLSANSDVVVTLLGLPMTQSELTLELISDDGLIRSLPLKQGDVWLSVPAGQKMYIKNVSVPNGIFDYEFRSIDPADLTYQGGLSTGSSVISYRYLKNHPEIQEPVSWTVEGYYTSESDAENKTNKKSLSDLFITSFDPVSQDGSISGERVDIVYDGATGTTVSVNLGSEISARLKSNTGAYVQRGSASNYWNLANPATGSRDAIAETANSYIVNAPGYYCFPLVVGNGIKDSGYNLKTAANYKDYKGNTITSPYLQSTSIGVGTPSSAYVVWEEKKVIETTDETDWNLIGNSITHTEKNGQIIYWCNFHIPANSIDQGCAVIAVTDGSQVMWSWTIWITDYIPYNYPDYDSDPDLVDIDCKNASNNTITFMPRNLGWVEKGVTSGTLYSQATAYVRLEQEGSSNYTLLTIDRPSRRIVDNGFDGHSPYYQWGRKDSLIPNNGHNTTSNLSIAGGRNRTFAAVDNKSTIPSELKYLILRPDLYLGYRSYYPYNGDVSNDNKFWNWWNHGATKNNANFPTNKTIYDPCPAGYSVPEYDAFTGFLIGGNSNTPNYYRPFNEGGYNKGYYFWSDYRENASASTDGMTFIFFPGLGWRGGSDGGLTCNNDGAYWTSGTTTYGIDAYAMGWGTIGLVTVHDDDYSRNYCLSIRPAREE